MAHCSSTTLDKKKKPSSRFAARRTLFHVWYHARSGAISAGQKSRTVADRTCPALIAPDRAWYHTWNSVLLASNLDDGSFFLSRVVLCSLCVYQGSCRMVDELATMNRELLLCPGAPYTPRIYFSPDNSVTSCSKSLQKKKPQRWAELTMRIIQINGEAPKR